MLLIKYFRLSVYKTLNNRPIHRSITELRDVQIKSKEFYHSEGNHRRYFYVIDTRGRVFLEESKHKNYATSLKDKKFLDLFFRMLRPNRTEFYQNCLPFVSFCGKEMNFTTVLDPFAPLAYSELLQDIPSSRDPTNSSVSVGTARLRIGESDLTSIFDPTQLYFDVSTGRIYHKIDGKRSKTKYLDEMLGLLHPELSQMISSGVDFEGLELHPEQHPIDALDLAQSAVTPNLSPRIVGRLPLQWSNQLYSIHVIQSNTEANILL